MPINTEAIVNAIDAAQAQGQVVLAFIVPIDPEAIALSPNTEEEIEIAVQAHLEKGLKLALSGIKSYDEDEHFRTARGSLRVASQLRQPATLSAEEARTLLVVIS